jgi:dipeptidyl-peptidase-4
MRARRPLPVLVAVLLSLACAGPVAARTATPTEITALMLVQPGALVGAGPQNLSWSPAGSLLAYCGPADPADATSATVLWLYDAARGEKTLLLDPTTEPDGIDVTSAQWAPAGDTMLLAGDTALWILDVSSGALRKAVDLKGRELDATAFTPDGARISYTLDSDLYVTTLKSGATQRLTRGGGETIFNGCLDWVYNEELATRGDQPGYAWSPDGRRLMYMRLDDRKVHADPVTDYGPIPATVSYTRYPSAGTVNPTVSLHYLTPGSAGKTRSIPLPAGMEYVLPFYAWTPDAREVLYITVNRDHTVLRLMAFDPSRRASRTLITETNAKFIDEDFYTAPVFLPDGEHFLWLSDRDGYMHAYLYAVHGGLERQLTKGDWLIDTTPYGILTAGRPVYVDPAGDWAYFNATKQSPLERQVYRVNVASGALEQLTTEAGFHAPALSGDGRYLVDQSSAVDTPPVTTVRNADGTPAGVLARCAGPALDLPHVSREFLTVKAGDGTELYAQLVKPQGFDPTRKYPVVVHWYGGGGLQMVSDRYGTTNIFNMIERDTLYTQAGYLVWRLDNRGTFGRGHAFETAVAGALGPVELQDQLAGVAYLKTLPYVDASRIGTDGKSFGGFLTLYGLIHEPDVFRCGVAGSGPTNWAWYDTIYTERYMRTPSENPDGYAATNLVDVAAQIEAAPLIIHGLADTNVHLQNSIDFIQALEKADRPFIFVPLPNENHHYEGDGLATALAASVDYFAEQLAGK